MKTIFPLTKSLARRPTQLPLLQSRSGQDDTGFDHVVFEILKGSHAPRRNTNFYLVLVLILGYHILNDCSLGTTTFETIVFLDMSSLWLCLQANLCYALSPTAKKEELVYAVCYVRPHGHVTLGFS